MGGDRREPSAAGTRCEAARRAPRADRGALNVFVLIGPGGVGKGTVSAALTKRVAGLWLSRSWTTRLRRPGEQERAYVWVTRERFLEHVASGGFYEWAEYLGNLYGTPLPEPPPGCDVLLEIDVDGAEQVVAKCPDAVVVLLLPPSLDVQRERLVARGDSEANVRRRLEHGVGEVARGRGVARFVVVNADLDTAVDELAGIVADAREQSKGPRCLATP